MIQLKKIGIYEVTLMKDVFGFYNCRIWIGFDYFECSNRNKFTAYRNALAKIND